MNTYPPDWKSISTRVKDEAGWRCVRCDAANSREGWRVLTVHHLDGDEANALAELKLQESAVEMELPF